MFYYPMNAPPQTLWIITEGIAGTENQCIGIAESLKTRFWTSLDIVIKRVNLKFPYSLWSPFWTCGEGPSMLTPNSSSISAPFPDIVIAGGRKAIGIARYIRKASMGHTFVCIVQHPRVRFDYFDLVAVPMHDMKKDCHPRLGQDLETTNIIASQATISCLSGVAAKPGTTITTNGAPNRITSQWLSTARDKWRDIITPLPTPRTAVLIGGNSKHHRLSLATMDRLIAHLHDLQEKRSGSLMITVSRRTPEDLRKKLQQTFAAHVPSTLIYTGVGDNPYAGFLAYADYIIVTTDSTSMISDAASTGKPIEFFPLPGGSKRNDIFLAHCRDLGIGISNTPYERWRDTEQVADRIENMINKNNI